MAERTPRGGPRKSKHAKMLAASAVIGAVVGVVTVYVVQDASGHPPVVEQRR
ncbi:hypothetical protein [Nocardioides sp. SYSU DS0663]|uniref:hypothetical protein n=1 Tax=Nocardioides sp. SYSU DS0663 TaxID=3416445 RepID=UPI003F4B1BE0